jgi:hypothetical protein
MSYGEENAEEFNFRWTKLTNGDWCSAGGFLRTDNRCGGAEKCGHSFENAMKVAAVSARGPAVIRDVSFARSCAESSICRLPT